MADEMDVEGFFSRWFRTRERITDLVDQQVWAEIPRNPPDSWVSIEQFHEEDLTDMDEPWLNLTVLEITCYAPDRPTARAIARAVKREAKLARGKHPDEGTITGVRCYDIGWRPDHIDKPAKAAYLVNIWVYSHPNKGEQDS